jgi:hypothetical protein
MPLIDPETGSQMVLFVVLLDARLTAHQDPSLIDWLLNAQTNAGDFLRSLAEAGLRADAENYPLLRPALLVLKNRYPQYDKPNCFGK